MAPEKEVPLMEHPENSGNFSGFQPIVQRDEVRFSLKFVLEVAAMHWESFLVEEGAFERGWWNW